MRDHTRVSLRVKLSPTNRTQMKSYRHTSEAKDCAGSCEAEMRHTCKQKWCPNDADIAQRRHLSRRRERTQPFAVRKMLRRIGLQSKFIFAPAQRRILFAWIPVRNTRGCARFCGHSTVLAALAKRARNSFRLEKKRAKLFQTLKKAREIPSDFKKSARNSFRHMSVGGR